MEYVRCVAPQTLSLSRLLTHLVQSLGNSGLKISKIILGTMSMGNPKWEGWVMNEEQSLPVLEHAYKCGINTWDTVGLLGLQ